MFQQAPSDIGAPPRGHAPQSARNNTDGASRLASRHTAPTVLFVLCLAPTLCLALPEDSTKPIHITGQQAELDRSAQTLVYSGEVRIDQGTLRVHAERMEVEYEADQVVRIIATGSPARYQQMLEGNAGLVLANASRITYHTQAEAVDLAGDAQLVQRGSELKGEFIRYDIVAGKVDAQTDTEDAVRMTLQPARRSR